MNLILYESQQKKESNCIQLSFEQREHFHKVLKAQKGDRLRVGELGGLLGTGEVVSVSDKEVVLFVTLDKEPPQKLPLHLYVALPRPKHLSRIIETLTTLGIPEVHFFHSYKVDKSFWSSHLLNSERIYQAQILGLQQARDTILPRVHFHRWYRPFVEDELPSLVKGGTVIVAHPYAHHYEPTQLKSLGIRHLVFGPEGGWIDFELDLLSQQGFQAYSFGPRILKLETALVSITSQLV